MTIDAPPHSRWLLQESVDQLAASHAAAGGAVVALARSAIGYSAATRQPALGPRLAGRRGGPRTTWLGVMALGTALFLAWLSVRLVQHLAAAPAAVAMLPGVLIALALAVTAGHAASPGERAPASPPCRACCSRSQWPVPWPGSPWRSPLPWAPRRGQPSPAEPRWPAEPPPGC